MCVQKLKIKKLHIYNNTITYLYAQLDTEVFLFPPELCLEYLAIYFANHGKLCHRI